MSNSCKPWDECLKYYNSGKKGGFNCSESTLLGLCESFGIEDNDIIPKVASPFGGGIGRQGYMCGSLSGALMFLGIKYGRKDVDDERAPAYDRAASLINKFIQKYGSVNCRDITGIDMMDKEVVKEKKEDVHQNICRPLVKQVCQWVIEELEK